MKRLVIMMIIPAFICGMMFLFVSSCSNNTKDIEQEGGDYEPHLLCPLISNYYSFFFEICYELVTKNHASFGLFVLAYSVSISGSKLQ